jgi:hypothetical protein
LGTLLGSFILKESASEPRSTNLTSRSLSRLHQTATPVAPH